jgi:hypothetical protein
MPSPDLPLALGQSPIKQFISVPADDLTNALNTLINELNALFQAIGASSPTVPQPANQVLAGPTAGVPALPTYRPLVLDDLPDPYNTQLVFRVDDYGAAHDFVGDDAVAINAAIAAAVAAGGGRVILGPYAYWAQSASITVPSSVALTVDGHYQRYVVGADNTALPGSIYFPTGNSLLLQGGACVGLALLNDIVHFSTPGTTRATVRAYAASFAGTGVKIGTGGLPIISNGSILRDCYIGGFDRGILIDRASNVLVTDILGDCRKMLKIDQSLDDCYLSNIECIGQLTTGATGAHDAFAILGMADNGAGLIRLTLAANNVVNGENDLMVTAGTGGQGARGLWPGIVVVDATHVDLPGSAFTPVVNCTTTAGSQYVPVASTANLQPGMTVTGSNIPAGATIGAVSYGLSAIFLDFDHKAAASGATSLTFNSTAYTPSSSTLRYEGAMRAGPAYDFVRADGTRGNGIFAYGYQTAFAVGGGVGMDISAMQADDFSALCPNQNAVPVGIDMTASSGLGYGNVFTGSLITTRGISIRNNVTAVSPGYSNSYNNFRCASAGTVLEHLSGAVIVNGLQGAPTSAIILNDTAEDPIISGCSLPNTSIYGTVVNPKWLALSSMVAENLSLGAGLANLTVRGNSDAVITMTDLNEVADAKTFQVANTASQLIIRTLNDVGGAGTSMMTFNRTGAAGTRIGVGVPLALKTYTVATLPTGMPAGAYAIVTDALAPSYNGIVVGGGGSTIPVFFNSVDWRCG